MEAAYELDLRAGGKHLHKERGASLLVVVAKAMHTSDYTTLWDGERDSA